MGDETVSMVDEMKELFVEVFGILRKHYGFFVGMGIGFVVGVLI